ncbi:hypothetical protein H2198_006523 [Neophaeococcomyces mojaviensis]|uniref:Uncharacterized protein n=1 Tax=Neophaeococcomyces mojaviensis TaxID=3383035 RepID=A0ACC3A368_9EURO|nr:hypothetical protein H2198_006523 [Knufia sp. JES_112]
MLRSNARSVQKLEPRIFETAMNKHRPPQDKVRSIEFENLQFAYPHRPDTRVLKGIFLRIEKGQFVAFVGASGCGKSTMIAMLERFYDPVRVQQEPTLYAGTVRENISFGDPELEKPCTDEAIEEACRAANAWDFVLSLPEGLSTQCGNNGSQFSGGQRQRLAIARALIRKPNLLLLDEATSALDTQSEKIVQDALKRASEDSERITIAVTHRLSTVRDADLICVFYGGRIIETGTHTELLSGQGKMYRAMCKAQGLT